MILLLLVLSACQDKPLAIDEAQNLQKNGDLVQAFIKYEEIVQGDFDLLDKEKAKLQLQDIYASYAKKIGTVDEDLAIQLNQKIIERWKYSTSADQAQDRIDVLEKKKEERSRHKEQDKKDCLEAQESKNRDFWEIYAQKHPVGVCIKEARMMLAKKVTTPEHRMQLESILTKCEDIQKKCSQYESRFMTIKGKKEIDYLTTTFSVFLEKLNERDNDIQKEIVDLINQLESQNFDTQELRETAKQRCQPCITTQDNLADVRGCQKALSQNNKEGWDQYKKDFPDGACFPK